MVVSPGVAHRGLQDVRRPTSIVGLMLDPHSPSATAGSSFSKADLQWLFEQFGNGALSCLSHEWRAKESGQDRCTQ